MFVFSLKKVRLAMLALSLLLMPQLVSAANSVSLNLNASAFTSGDTLTVTGTTVATGPVSQADLYYGLRLPDGTLLIMQPNGSLSTNITPFQANASILNTSAPVLSYTLTGLEAAGTYTMLAALMQPGTLNVIGQMASVPFTVAGSAAAPAAVNVTGNWTGQWSSTAFPGSAGGLTFTANQLGNAISGSGAAANTIIGVAQGAVTGTLTGNSFVVTIALAGGATAQFAGTLNAIGNTITGTYSLPLIGDSGTWTVSR